MSLYQGSFCVGLLSVVFLSCPLNVLGQLWCTETEECAGTSYDTEMMYCWALSACADSTLTGSLVDCAGFMGCFGADLAVSDDIFCESEDACALATLSTTGGDVYCGGYYGCAGVRTINATGGIVECPGEAACRYGEIIYASEGVYCFGDYGCWYTQISGTESIRSYGYRSSYMGDISSSGVSSLQMIFGGYQGAYFASLSCESNTTCTISCEQSTSCFGLTVYCYGTCSIDCDDGYDCPTVYYFDDDDTSLEMKAKWEQEKQSKQELRQDHKKRFTTFYREASKIQNKHEKAAKLAQFNAEIEDEITEWGTKYNKKMIKNAHVKTLANGKQLDVAPFVSKKSNEKATFAMINGGKDSLMMPLVVVGIMLVFSLMGNGYMIWNKKNDKLLVKSQDGNNYQTYQSL